jgi:hypothetical protein
MRCPACGREMLDRGTYFECSNFLCDYEEAIESREVSVKAEQELPEVAVGGPVLTRC